MGRSVKGREQFLRLVSEKMLYLSSGAAETLGDRAELYESGDVLALVGEPHGTYHLGRKSSGCKGRNLCVSELAGYLMEKYGVETGARLPVWQGAEETGPVIFFGRPGGGAPQRLDESFHKLELSYRKRYGDWVFVEDNCVSFTAELRALLPRRLSLYEAGRALALKGDRTGSYSLELRSGRKGEAIYAGQLAEFLRRRFSGQGRGLLLCARALGDGVCFAAAEEDLWTAEEEAGARLLDLGVPGDCFLRLTRKGSLYFSSKAAERVGERFRLLAAGDLLALQRGGEGDFQIRRTGYQSLVHSAALRAEIAELYPGAEKLYLAARGDMFLLSRRPEGPEREPVRSRFRRLELGGRAGPPPSGRGETRTGGEVAIYK